MEGMEEIVQEFLVESHENLDQLDQDLLALERDPGSRELLSSIFRTLHTIKGTSGFLALHTLEKVAHAGESLLSKLRDGEMTLNPTMATVLLEMVDAVRALLGHIEQDGNEGEETYSELTAKLHALLEGRSIADISVEAATSQAASSAAAAAGAAEQAADAASEAAQAAAEAESVVVAQHEAAAEHSGEQEHHSEQDDAVVAAAAAQGHSAETAELIAGVAAETAATVAAQTASTVAAATAEAFAESAAVAATMVGNPTGPTDGSSAGGEAHGSHGVDGMVSGGGSHVATVDPAKAAQQAADAQSTAAKAAKSSDNGDKKPRSVAESSIRVDVDLLDSLMNLVGELVLSRNQLVQRAAASEDQELQRSMHRLSLVASELQEGVMKTRMQPIENVWSKIPRVVRDLSNQMGRQIRVEMEGKETELDKTILEAIKDPLTHLVRNSCDHGIEPPDVRTANGKPAEGVLLMRAFHEGGQVNIEIIDDGAGINTERVKDKAVERGLMSREEADRLSERDAQHLIFRAGFSTAEKVSNVSGRGVGMDVVKTNIEKIGGVIDVSSVYGEGTTTRIKIPLTLAIIPALLVRGKNNMFAIPQVNLLELVRLDKEQAAERLETIQGTPVYRLRGQLLPLVDLRHHIGVEEAESDTTFIAVLRADQRQFGLVVDDIEDTEEIVVKPLGKQLRGIDLYAGATLMGDGRVALILDTNSLAAHAGMINDSGEAAKRAAEEAAKRASADATSLLVVKLSNGRRVALPLSVVERLEEFAMSRVETVGQNQVVQYRGVILPLLRLADDYGSYSEVDEAQPLQVVVCQHRGQLFGFVVAQVLDIVEDELAIRTHLDTGGNLGSAVVNEHVTELLNIDTALAGMLAPEAEQQFGDMTSYSGAYAAH
ncbi:chemotaxis protein CheA [Gephyromycinifex aptenodytis]|uniref:chemotaxis protein CheA n=1 Tax=Gephyromycinifex aptenodytis TaxID=2716227 RepID=UPI001446CEBB|nr:chemotaxis protein CheA [Gephyromycinifex aptenodytis]